MKFTARAAAVAAAAAAAVVVPASNAAAEPCVSGAEVRKDVHALVASLRDDVPRRSTRAQLAAALVETLKASRGAKADTPQERSELGREISVLARTLKAADTRLARKAIVLQILALTEQRERGGFTAEERADIEAAVNALRNATVAKTDGRAEGRAVAAAFRALHEQFDCRPA